MKDKRIYVSQITATEAVFWFGFSLINGLWIDETLDGNY